jgi:hypothetical protein
MDPSPFRDRDLDPECEEFIVSWAREVHPDHPFKIEIHLEREPVAQNVLEQIPLAVQRHFDRESEMQGLRLRRMVREGRTSLAVGLLALTACTTAATLAPVPALGAFGNVAVESLVIAGWVAMWHPLEVLLYGVWPVRRERRLLERLANAEVVLTTSVQAQVAA